MATHARKKYVPRLLDFALSEEELYILYILKYSKDRFLTQKQLHERMLNCKRHICMNKGGEVKQRQVYNRIQHLTHIGFVIHDHTNYLLREDEKISLLIECLLSIQWGDDRNDIVRYIQSGCETRMGAQQRL